MVNILFVCLILVDGQQKVNGHSSRLPYRSRSRHRDPQRAPSHSSDREEEEENIMRRSLKRRTARAAVNKIKLLEASLSEEDCEEENLRRSSGRLRSSRRLPVIQSSSESEGPPTHGTQPSPANQVFLKVCRKWVSARCSRSHFLIVVMSHIDVLHFNDSSFSKAQLSLSSVSKIKEFH